MGKIDNHVEMNANNPPPIFSLEFHLSFFPALLRRLLHSKNRRYESTFAGHISLEFPVMAIVSILLGIYGFSAVIGNGSIIGWICVIMGAGGFIYLLTGSIRSCKDYKPSFEYFRTIMFLFFAILGITTGLAIGTNYHLSYGVKIITGLIGLIPGYIVGIFGGLWTQYLGWMASLLDIIALAAIAGMIVLDIVMLL